MPRDPEADDLGRLYDRLGASLYRYALMILADPAAAEDVLQDVFSRIAARWPRGVTSIDGYLRRAVRNASFDALRHKKRSSGDHDTLLEPLAENSDPAERLALEAGLRALPPDQREVVHLKIYEGLTFQEIADLTGAPPNTVAGRYRYALEKLRALFGAETRT